MRQTHTYDDGKCDRLTNRCTPFYIRLIEIILIIELIELLELIELIELLFFFRSPPGRSRGVGKRLN